MQELVHSGTELLDLGGKVVVSGFIDSHVHMIFGGLQVYKPSPLTMHWFVFINSNVLRHTLKSRR